MSEISAGPLPIRSVDPRTGMAFGPTFADATPDQLDAVVGDACRAASEMARLSAAQISSGLARLADALDAQAADLARLADHETALGLTRLTGEVARTSGQLRMFGALTASGEHLDVVIDHLADAAARDLRRVNVPLGPVVVFGASNFPFAFSTLGGDTAAALAAGCPVIVKAHPAHPQLSSRVAEIASGVAAAAGWPAGAIASVNGASPVVGQALVRHPGVRAVAFTGSTAGGRTLFDVAAARPAPIPVYAEMGSLNPVVLVDVTAGQATGWAKQLAASVTLGWGQFCTKPGIIAVPLTVADEFTTAMRNALGGAEPGWALTAGIASAYLRKLEETAGLLIDRTWVSPVIGTGHAMPAAMAVATVEQLVAHRGLAEEHFGPFTLVVTHDGLADIARIMAHLQGSLTGTLITGRPAAPAASEVIEVLSRHVGRIIVNGVPTGVVVTAAQMHGAPYPSSTSPAHTSVGTAAIRRFLRPVAYQDVPNELLPPSLAAANPLGMPRTIDGRHEHSAEPSSARAAEARTDPEHPADTEREDE